MEHEQRVIEQIKKGNKEALEKVYQENKEAFINFLIKIYQAKYEEALDVYQITILRFYDNIIYGKLTHLNSTLKSYLFSIGKNIYKEYLRAQQRDRNTKDQLILQFVLEESGYELEEEILKEKEIYYKKMAVALIKLGDPCKKLLESFYYEKRSMKEIAKELNFKNANVAKTKKLKCLKRLKVLIN